MRVFRSFDELSTAVGSDLGTSDWMTVDQTRVDVFGVAVGDHRSPDDADGPATVPEALVLSLIPVLKDDVLLIDTPGAGLNYGCNRIRYPAPVRVGSRVRAHARLLDATDLPSGMQLVVRYIMEVEGQAEPGCVADTVALWLHG